MTRMASPLQLREFVDLRPYNTFGISATARYFVSVDSAQTLRAALAEARQKGLPLLILGGGSNLLFIGDFPGLVVHIAIRGVQVCADPADSQSVLVTASAGENWHALVRHCMDHGYYGLENLALIPGSAGAAPVQNIGAYGVELKDVFSHLQALLTDSGEIITLDREHCAFGYRDSVFKRELKARAIVLSITLRLGLEPRVTTSYGSLMAALADHPAQVTPEVVFETVCGIRRTRLPDPEKLGNAGSFFKNPVIPVTKYEELLKEWPDLPYFSSGPENVTHIKIPAAWLIEQAGWKGRRVQAAGVHQEQPLVMVNHGGASGEQILQLAMAVRDSVEAKFGIPLEPEVQIVDGK
jgi:UDP-N-acetylmuramate dehydrogenase